MRLKIAHITSLHPRYDIRIFVKECKALVSVNFDVYLIVADGKGDEEKDGVKIIDVGKDNSKYKPQRTIITAWRIYKKVLKLGISCVHLHDPELLICALSFKKKKIKVIYDSHEDLPRQTLSKEYIPIIYRKYVAWFIEIVENYICKRIDLIITATPHINIRFLKINPNSHNINNYPIIDELKAKKDNYSFSNEKIICFVGAISEARGIKDLIKALEILEGVKLYLAGSFSEPEFEDEIKKMNGWSKVEFFGQVSRDKIAIIMEKSICGIVTFHPFPNHYNAQPNKMFEYMSVSLPVVASDFNLWRAVIENDRCCGICVNPQNPVEIANAIKSIIENPEKSKSMGENGVFKIKNKYNWQTEGHKLTIVYKNLLNESINNNRGKTTIY